MRLLLRLPNRPLQISDLNNIAVRCKQQPSFWQLDQSNNFKYSPAAAVSPKIALITSTSVSKNDLTVSSPGVFHFPTCSQGRHHVCKTVLTAATPNNTRRPILRSYLTVSTPDRSPSQPPLQLQRELAVYHDIQTLHPPTLSHGK
jgi:hypothetical protein